MLVYALLIPPLSILVFTWVETESKGIAFLHRAQPRNDQNDTRGNLDAHGRQMASHDHINQERRRNDLARARRGPFPGYPSPYLVGRWYTEKLVLMSVGDRGTTPPSCSRAIKSIPHSRLIALPRTQPCTQIPKICMSRYHILSLSFWGCGVEGRRRLSISPTESAFPFRTCWVRALGLFMVSSKESRNFPIPPSHSQPSSAFADARVHTNDGARLVRLIHKLPSGEIGKNTRTAVRLGHAMRSSGGA